MLKTAEVIIRELKSKKCKLVLPLDIICANSLNNTEDVDTFSVDCCPIDKMILDIRTSDSKKYNGYY